MRLRHCSKGDLVWVRDPYTSAIVHVKVDEPYIENYHDKGIKVLFEDSMFLSWDIMDFNKECWKDLSEVPTE